ncbi:unnamed protein product [Effrenium voratum]|nr:unnamed protein product [Effrenium voratum]
MSRQLDLMSLSFHRRWEKVGVRADLEDLLHPPPLEGHEQSFSSISASQRLVYLDSVRPVSKEVTIEATPLPYETKPKAKPKPNKKILQKMALVNVLMGVEDAPEVNPRGLPYDPLETVLAGMQELHDEDGPMAVLQQRRLAKFRQQRPPTAVRRCTEKAPAMAPTPLLDASWQPESREKRRFNQPKRLLALGEFNSWAQRTFGSLEAARDALGMALSSALLAAATYPTYPKAWLGG